MRLEALHVHRVRLPLRVPWHTARGREDTTETLLIKVQGDGLTAWVESCPLARPLFLPETAASALVNLRDVFGPVVMGHDFSTGEELQGALQDFRGCSFAKAAIDLSWWALACMRDQQPLYMRLGGKGTPVATGAAVSIQPSMDDLIQAVDRAIDAQAPRIKLKMCPGHDLDVLRQVRDHAPDVHLQVDCNGAYSLEDLPLFRELDKLQLDMIEQPLHPRDLAGHARLQREIATPICLDESICSVVDAELAIRDQACRIINIKPGRVGGLTPALKIIEKCREAEIGCWVGSMLESDIGTAINLHLATVPGMTHAHALPISGHFYNDVLIDPPICQSSPGQVTPGPEPWIGCNVDEDRIRELTVEECVLRA